MAKVYLALGSNIGDSIGCIKSAIKLLGAELQNMQVAHMYISKAVGYTDQPDFYNTAITGETTRTPHELLKFAKDIEQKMGRVHRFRWGPREIDIDLIFYDDQILDTPELTIPHPRFAERDFVLRPLVDIESGKIDPISNTTIDALLAALPGDGQAILQKV
jgi:2-amino-4-hydroxy-6-hydroxymethyldihydropteridine diphosphokinase